MAFTLQERQALGIHGLLPPRFKTQEEQVSLCKENIERYQEDLNKYIYLVGLQVSPWWFTYRNEINYSQHLLTHSLVIK